MELERRPDLTSALSGEEFRRWYWLKRELDAFARSVGLSTLGGKETVAERIARWLEDGESAPGDRPHARSRVSPAPGDLTRHTPVRTGQRMTAQVRAFMVRECGAGFRFDRYMRAFFAREDARTLGDAIDHWFATRGLPNVGIEPQFEYNRFVRAWRAAHPGATHPDVVAAWQAHRALPVERRPETG
jgi:hypothetical protein